MGRWGHVKKPIVVKRGMVMRYQSYANQVGDDLAPAEFVETETIRDTSRQAAKSIIAAAHFAHAPKPQSGFHTFKPGMH